MRRRTSLFFSLIIIFYSVGITLGVISCSSFTHTTATSSAKIVQKPVPPRVVIPQNTDLFEPFILVIQPGTTVTWENDDTVKHLFGTTPDTSNYLNPQPFTLEIASGTSGTVTFRQPGLYHYYEKKVDTWSSELARVRANPGKTNYPLAMDAIIWVQGHIDPIPSVAINEVPAGHDDYAVEFIAIKIGGSVLWHNFDEDPHFIGLVPGWPVPINPAEIGLYRIAGTNDTPGGQSVTITFSISGLYYYHCHNHSHYDESEHRIRALPDASEYPVPMEGFVLVIA